MYSSLLNFSQLSETNTSTMSENWWLFLIKAGVAIALFFPLIALAAVLIARIGMLWLFIATSPFLVLMESFKDTIKMEKITKVLSLSNVTGIVFAPVITVFALSISLIFLTALGSSLKSPDAQVTKDIQTNLTIVPIATNDPNSQTIKVWSASQLEFKNFDRGGGLDWFSRLIVNFFAIGLLRTIVFMAIKSNSLGKAIWEKVQNFWSNMFQTMPILPIWSDGAKVGLGSMWKVLREAPTTYIYNRSTAQEWLWRSFINGETPNGEGGGIAAAEYKTIATRLVTSSSINEEIASINKNRGEENKITQTEIFGNSAGLNSIQWEIDKLWENKAKALSSAITIFGMEFQNRIKTGSLDTNTSIAELLNTNEITKEYAKLLVNTDLKVTTAQKQEKTFRIWATGADGNYVVTEVK